MREVYLTTEEPDRERLRELEAEGASVADGPVVKRLADHEIWAQMYGEDAAGAAPAGGWGEG